MHMEICVPNSMLQQDLLDLWKYENSISFERESQQSTDRVIISFVHIPVDIWDILSLN